MSKAKFTQDQVNEAMAEFFEGTDASVEWDMLQGAGNNGPITIYRKGESDGYGQAAGE